MVVLLRIGKQRVRVKAAIVVPVMVPKLMEAYVKVVIYSLSNKWQTG